MIDIERAVCDKYTHAVFTSVPVIAKAVKRILTKPVTKLEAYAQDPEIAILANMFNVCFGVIGDYWVDKGGVQYYTNEGGIIVNDKLVGGVAQTAIANCEKSDIIYLINTGSNHFDLLIPVKSKEDKTAPATPVYVEPATPPNTVPTPSSPPVPVAAAAALD